MKSQKNMKGFIFTLDAVFALVIAAIGTSILLYVNFTGIGVYGISASQAPAILQTMLKTNIASASSGSLYASYLASSAYGSTYPWRQLAHDGALSSSTGYSLQSPYLLYTFNAPSGQLILPAVAVDDGAVALAAASTIYILNSTSGKQQFSFSVGTGASANIVSSPAIYDGMVYYANKNNVVRGVNIYNGTLQWSFNASNSITTPMEILKQLPFLWNLKWILYSKSDKWKSDSVRHPCTACPNADLHVWGIHNPDRFPNKAELSLFVLSIREFAIGRVEYAPLH